jgi:ABC-type branched-subunit amino acid transport system ATPase component
MPELPVAGPRDSVWSLVTDPIFRQQLGAVRRHWWMYLLAILSQVSQTGVAVLVAEVLRRIFDANFRMPAPEMNLLLAALIGLSVVRMAATYLDAWFGTLLNETVVYAMRRDLLNHIQRLPLGFHEKGHSSDVTNIIYRDLEIAKDFVVSDIQRIIALPVSLVVAGAYLAHLDPWLGAIGFTIGPLQLLSNLVLKGRFQEALKRQRKVSRDVFFTIGETLQGVREVKANQMENQVDAQMAEIQVRGVRDNVDLSQTTALRSIAREAPREIGTVAGIAAGAWLASTGRIGPGEVVAFLSLIDRLAAPFTTVATVISNLQRAVEGARRLYDTLALPVEDKKHGVALTSDAPEIEFRDVSFGYDADRLVLEGLSFRVRAGKSLALVGPSGSGKSTIVKLLYRFYEPTAGQILIDGKPITEISIESLRDRLSLVSQEIYLFDATVAANIAAGRNEALRTDIERAADLAQAGFIRELPNGFDSEIGERGIKLSHGQKQRLSIARAILRDASVLILDEPTSALDVETEAGFQRDLGQWAQHCTKLIIAHRLTTIRDCDLVLFLDKGQAQEFGSPNDLAGAGGRFADYLSTQTVFAG